MKLAPGLIIAAPGSGSGKTTVTLGLLARLRQLGMKVSSAKVGPDFIDPAFHSAASGRPCHNLDSWAMSDRTLGSIAASLGRDSQVVIAEGVMGLFDGAPNGEGSAADLSRRTGWPVILVVDASGMARSAAALVHGFTSFDPQLRCAGVVFNRVGSPAHAALLRGCLDERRTAVFGCILRNQDLAVPDRHLGLVQAREHPDLQSFLNHAAGAVADGLSVDALLGAARRGELSAVNRASIDRPSVPILGQRISVADDRAFAFSYDYVLDGWRRSGATVTRFSPLADEPPPDDSDAVYLPGGYPELHAGRLAAATRFKRQLCRLAARGCPIYGECGGYMTLGELLVDGDGVAHPMVGLLPLRTSFANPKLSLGYREIELSADCILGPAGTRFRGHEFHFASESEPSRASDVARPFVTNNASGKPLGPVGMRRGSVLGSFMHLMDYREGLHQAGQGNE